MNILTSIYTHPTLTKGKPVSIPDIVTISRPLGGGDKLVVVENFKTFLNGLFKPTWANPQPRNDNEDDVISELTKQKTREEMINQDLEDESYDDERNNFEQYYKHDFDSL